MSDDLLIKFLLRETGPEEDLLVNEWVSADAANQKHFSQVETIWKSSEKLASRSTVDENAAWIRFQEKLEASKKQKPIIKPLYQRYSWLKVAAVFIVLAAGWSIYTTVFRLGETTLMAEASVLKGTLPDGSEVALNKNSILSYPKSFSGNQRTVQLEKGDVFFHVTPDKSKPFIIKVDKVSVRVVGTSFNVKHLKNDTEVIVETGIVKVSRGSQEVELHPGEKVLIKGTSGELVREANTDKLYTYYRTNLFVADSTPLWRVVEILNEAFEANIIIENPKLRNLTLTTTFKNEKLDTILNVIADTFDLKVIRQNGKIILK